MTVRAVAPGPLPEPVRTAVRGLYEEAFPPYERVAFEEIERAVETGRQQLWLDDSALAFAVTTQLGTSAGDVLLEYLAVDPEHRSRGLGRAVITDLLATIANPVVLEVEDPVTSRDPFAARRVRFYLRQGAEIVPHTEGYRMPNLDGPGTLPMLLLDLAPARRRDRWQPGSAREVITQIWTAVYGVAGDDPRLLDVLTTVGG